MASIFEKLTVQITVEDYERLIRDSEKVETLKRMFNNVQIVTTDDVKAILGVEKSKEEITTEITFKELLEEGKENTDETV